MSALHHYTCEHGARGIRSSGYLTPHHHWLLDRPITWLTDLERPDRWALGLCDVTLRCDHTLYRVSVASGSHVMPWSAWAQAKCVPPVSRALLEEGSQCRHWWVAEVPLRALAITATKTLARQS